MILPKNIPHSLRCPWCQPLDVHDNLCAGWEEQEAKLEWQKANTGSISETLVYYCDKCKNGFTTTESDTISLSKYQSKKRSLLRKEKIIRCIK